jgi:hypothetical protein
MAIIASDIEVRLSGGASNTSPAAALGGAMSTVAGGVITTNVLNNLFDDVSGDESAAGDIEYRGIYVKNNHGSLTWQTVKAWLSSLTTSTDDELAIALADEGLNAAMETIADESTAPTGPSFSSPVSKATGLSLGNIPFGQYYGIWVRRTVTAAAAAIDANSGELSCEGDTSE